MRHAMDEARKHDESVHDGLSFKQFLTMLRADSRDSLSNYDDRMSAGASVHSVGSHGASVHGGGIGSSLHGGRDSSVHGPFGSPLHGIKDASLHGKDASLHGGGLWPWQQCGRQRAQRRQPCGAAGPLCAGRGGVPADPAARPRRGGGLIWSVVGQWEAQRVGMHP